MPPVRTTTATDEEIRLPIGGSFVITDELGNELFRVTAVGDAVQVSGQTIAATSAVPGLTATATELNTLAGVTPGTVAAGKAIVTTANKHIDALAISAGGLAFGAGAGTAITATAAELNALAGQGATAADVAKLHAITATAAALNIAPVGVAAGYKIARGESALDGANPTTVASGLTSIIAAVATIKGTGAPGASTSLLTVNINGTDIDVYGWKPTGAALTDLVASGGTEGFYWIAVGT